jgi:hypothetical protein
LKREGYDEDEDEDEDGEYGPLNIKGLETLKTGIKDPEIVKTTWKTWKPRNPRARSAFIDSCRRR